MPPIASAPSLPPAEPAIPARVASSGARAIRLSRLRRGDPLLARCVGGWLLSLLACLLWQASFAAQAGATALSPAPAMLIGGLWTLWFGLPAGGVLVCIAAMLTAFAAGMPAAWAVLYISTDVLALAVLYLGFRALPLVPDFSSLRSAGLFLLISLASASFASLETLVWVYARPGVVVSLWPLWLAYFKGLLLNILLQSVLLWLFGRRIEHWLASVRFLVRQPVRLVFSLWAGGLLLAALLLYVYLAVRLQQGYIEQAFYRYDRIGWPAVALSATQTLQVVHIVLTVLAVFFAVFASIVLRHWTGVMTRSARQLALLNQKLAELALTDELTGLYNRRAFMQMAERELANAQRHGVPCSLLLIDIDHFKRVNDVFGHRSGDVVLRTIGHALPAVLRPSDLAARYGGEEIVMLLRFTPLDEALEVAERVRVAIAQLRYPAPAAAVTVTVSAGVAEARLSDPDLGWLFERTDRALYQAKSGGRNRVECDLAADSQA